MGKLRFTVIGRDSRHVRVRVASFYGGQWYTNGSLTFSVEEWHALKTGAVEIETIEEAKDADDKG